MKKALALLLALVMCLSLAACGEKTQTVEITMDNWQEFFEIRLVEQWIEDDFGDVNFVEISPRFYIREEYRDKIIFDTMDFAVGYQVDTIPCDLEVDWENKAFYVGNALGEPIYTDTNTWSSKYAEESFVKEDGYLFQFRDWGIGKDDLEAIKNDEYRFCDFYSVKITRIEGTIEIKGELLDLPASTLPSMPEWEEPTHAEDTGSEETPVPEETIPEETEATEPEPVYEAIELTAENFWQYFEIIHTYKFLDDAFGDIYLLEIYPILTIKEEYAEHIDVSKSTCVIEMNVVRQKTGISIDIENEVYTIGEILEETTFERLFDFAYAPDNSSFFEHGENWNMISRPEINHLESDAEYVYLLSSDPADFEILRIKGIIYIEIT